MWPAAIDSHLKMVRPSNIASKSWLFQRAGRFIPLGPINLALMILIGAIRRNHPELFERMGSGAKAVFLIDPVDLPVIFRIQPMRFGIVECRDRSSSCTWDARVSGPIKTLLGMIHGDLDGDALFFSRDISIEGNTEAILALRNAIDAVEIDLISQIGGFFGPFRAFAMSSARAAISFSGLLTGSKLSRQDT
jgi:predicted lipid carrier protein YhbT